MVKANEGIKRLKYTGKQITKAGQSFLNDEITKDPQKFSAAMDVLSYWRSCHTVPLENALKKLRQVVKSIDKNALYAKRLKRYPSIQTKLRRFPKMSLKNMQDIGGCRVIVASSKRVEKIVRALRAKPEFKLCDGKHRHKDYIKNPKSDGYRSYHLIGNFPDEFGKSYRIEVQVRTVIQHYWATALEIIDLFTKQSLKTNQGEKIWSEFFINLSEQFAAMDNIHTFAHSDSNKRLKSYASALVEDGKLASGCLDVVKLSRRLEVKRKLNAFAASLQIVDNALKKVKVSGYVLLKIDLVKSQLEYEVFKETDSKKAEMTYTEAEKCSIESNSKLIVALVYTDHLNQIKQAYPNFFADSTQFIDLLDTIHGAEEIFRASAVSKSLLSRIFAKANFQ